MVAAVIVAAVSAFGAYLAAVRRLSGKIATSEASELWEESKSIREDYRLQIERAAKRVADLERRIAEAERRNVDVERQNLDLERSNAELVKRLDQLDRENDVLKDTIQKWVSKSD